MRKPLVLLRDEIKSPPFSAAARIEAGTLRRSLQDGESLGMPQSRPMPSIGRRCHELRIRDEDGTQRIFSRIDPDAVLVAGVLISNCGFASNAAKRRSILAFRSSVNPGS